MGKPSGKKKKKSVKAGDSNPNHHSKSLDKDEVVFITMSQELKEEGNKLFQKRDHEGAMLKYEKALKLLPRNHIDVAYLRSNMAACYMQMGIGEYPRAIHECNLALEASPKYSKALLKRSRCYEALNRLDLALRDVTLVLNTEPNNLTALEIAERVKGVLEKKGIKVDDKGIISAPEYREPPCASPTYRVVKEKTKKKKSNRASEDKVVVEVNASPVKEEEPQRNVKFIFGEDIRWAQIPSSCSIQQLKEIIQDRFPSVETLLIKYKDQEGDLVTITSTEELRWAEALGEKQGSIRLYIVQVNAMQEPLLEGVKNIKMEVPKVVMNQQNVTENGQAGLLEKEEKGLTYIDHWITQFAWLFQNHCGFSSDAYLDLHDLGMKLYSEAIEDTVTSEEAQELFEIAEDKFQEMSALALFNWGNVHMSKSRKGVSFSEDVSKESMLMQAKTAYEWSQKELVKAGMRYKEALRIKPDLYEAYLALGKQQFEQAKLSWCYAIGSKVDLETWPSSEVLQLFNNAEDNMENGLRIWEEMEEQRLTKLFKSDQVQVQLKQLGLDSLFKDISAGEAEEQSTNMRSHINILWGTILYERSVVEFKLGIPLWEECLEVAVEKFELAGASATDIGVILKNHCASRTAIDGLEFKIDEIVQAWNEMYDAKRWQLGEPSSRLEPLFRRRAPKLHHILEHILEVRWIRHVILSWLYHEVHENLQVQTVRGTVVDRQLRVSLPTGKPDETIQSCSTPKRLVSKTRTRTQNHTSGVQAEAQLATSGADV